MALILLSGRPGAGKTEFGNWLSERHRYIHVETDRHWGTWERLVCVQDLNEAVATHNQVRSLGPDVIIEWGFKPRLLGCVRLLRRWASTPGGSMVMRRRLVRDTSIGGVTLRR
jgi:hypothetical protein